MNTITMKTTHRILAAAVAMATIFQSCDGLTDFGDINKSPNAPSTAFSEYLFSFACRYVPYFVLGSATNGYDPWQQEWTGYLSESKNNQYGPLGTTSQYSTSTIYLYPLKNLHLIVQMNEDEPKKATLMWSPSDRTPTRSRRRRLWRLSTTCH